MRRTLLLASFIVAAAACDRNAPAPSSSSHPSPTTLASAPAMPAATVPHRPPFALLEQPVPVHFSKVHLQDALARLAKSAGLSLYLDRKALVEARIPLATPMTLEFDHPIPLQRALALLMTESGTPFEYSIENNILEITSVDAMNHVAGQCTRVYNVSALVHQFADESDAFDLGSPESAVRRLSVFIMKTIAPETWRDAGGTVGSIEEFPGLFAINTTRHHQMEIAALLAQLQQNAPHRLPGRPSADPVPVLAGETAALADATSTFAFDLLPHLSRQNLAFSPYSLWTAGELLCAASQGTTRQELARAINLPEQNSPDIAAFQAALLAPTATDPAADPPATQPDHPTLDVQTSWFTSPAAPFKPDFLALAQKRPGLTLRTLDFSNPQTAAAAINDLISRQTRGRIPAAVAPDRLRASSFILTNTLYFKGAWANPFDPKDTAPGAFHIPGEKARTVPMMTLRAATLDYAATPEYRLVRIPYAGNAYSLVILLPTDLDGLPALEENLSAAQWQRLLSQLAPAGITLHLPRFTITTTHELIAPLQALGVRAAFAPGADFSAATAAAQRLGLLQQHVTLIVDEKGTEAAAATVASGLFGESPRPPRHPITFRVDHPCLMVLLHNPTSTPLFLARLTNPAPAQQ